MDDLAIVAYINRHFYGAQTVRAPGCWLFCFGPYADKYPWIMVPFASLITVNRSDDICGPDRPGVLRLNIGVRRGVYRAIYGSGAGLDPEGKPLISGYDYSRIKAAMPDPICAQLGWVCILNPTNEQFELCKDLISNAYRFAVVEHNDLIETSPERSA